MGAKKLLMMALGKMEMREYVVDILEHIVKERNAIARTMTMQLIEGLVDKEETLAKKVKVKTDE